MKVVKVLALPTECLYPLGDIPGIHLCQRFYQTQGHSVVRRIKSTSSGIKPATFWHVLFYTVS